MANHVHHISPFACIKCYTKVHRIHTDRKNHYVYYFGISIVIVELFGWSLSAVFFASTHSHEHEYKHTHTQCSINGDAYEWLCNTKSLLFQILMMLSKTILLGKNLKLLHETEPNQVRVRELGKLRFPLCVIQVTLINTTTTATATKQCMNVKWNNYSRFHCVRGALES